MSEANAAVLSESDGYKHILAALAAHSSSGSVLEHVLLVSIRAHNLHQTRSYAYARANLHMHVSMYALLR